MMAQCDNNDTPFLSFDQAHNSSWLNFSLGLLYRGQFSYGILQDMSLVTAEACATSSDANRKYNTCTLGFCYAFLRFHMITSVPPALFSEVTKNSGTIT
jgi:hypothetical protein